MKNDQGSCPSPQSPVIAREERRASDAPVTTAHTPTPWRVGPHYLTDIESAHGRIAECGAINSPQGIANAAFIVRAVNLHDKFAAQLKQADQARSALQQQIEHLRELRESESQHFNQAVVLINHWEDRAVKAEQQVESLQQQIEALRQTISGIVLRWRTTDATDASSRGYQETANTLQVCANDLEQRITSLEPSNGEKNTETKNF